MTVQNIQSALSPVDAANADQHNEAAAMTKFQAKTRQHRATYQAFIGQDGDTQIDLGWSQRRRIMQALRKSTAVLGMGQKSRIGRLGGGAAIGAIIAGFASPAAAQYAAGGGVASDSQSTAVGSGAVAGQAGVQTVDTNGDGIADLTLNQDTAVGANASATGGFATAIGNGVSAQGLYASAIGSSNTATGNAAIALGRLNTVDSFGAGTTMVQQGVLNRVAGAGNQTLGNGATDVTAAGIGIGTNNTVDGAGVAVGSGNLVNNTGSSGFAFGNANAATGAYSVTTGMGNTASATSAIAIGTVSVASGNTAIAMGRQSTASGQTSIAMGNVATANQTNAIAIGHSTQATGTGAIAIGGGTGGTSTNLDATAAKASATNTVAIGTNATATLANATALGNGSDATGASSIAIGDGSTASGTQSIAIGTGNTVSGNNSGAIGDPTTITGSGSYSLGNNNTINADNAFAIGNDITIAAGLNGSVGIGDASSVSAAVGTTTATVGATTFSGFAGTAPSSTVSIGASGAERTLTNVAAGRVNATSTDAINGSQLFSVATVVDANKTAINTLGNSLETVTGGGLVINPNGSIATAPSITAAGSTFSTVTGAIQALNAANTTTNTGLAAALGGGATVAANGTVTAPTYNVGGSTYNDVGSALSALNSGSLVAQTGGSPSAGQITVGAATGGTSISVAGTSGNRTVTGVLAGSVAAASTDAVNGGQINTLGTSIATNTGGGSTFNPVTGAVTAPTVNVGGTAYTNLTSAIEAAGAGFKLTTAATGTGTASGTTVEGIAAGETVTVSAGNNIAITQTGNQIAVALKPVLSGLTSVSITGGPTLAAGGITNAGLIGGVTAGSTATTSTEAINGAQLNTALTSVATDLGGGAIYNPITGVVTAPGYAIDGATYNNVGAALAALAADSKYIAFNSALAAASASGVNASAIGPNAQAAGNNATALGVNSDAVGTNSVALGSGAVASGTNSVALGAGSQAGTNNAGWAGTTIAGVTMTNAQNANAVVSVSGGTTNRQITGVADGAVTATSTDAVNGAQLFNTATALDTKATNIGAGLAASLGGGASVAANGTVTQPTINVNGTSFNNVTDAVQAAAAGFNFTTGATGSGVANGTSVAAIGAGETHTVTAGNNIITTQSGNAVSIALNPALSGITSLAITGGPAIDSTGIAMNGDGITGMANGAVNAASTDAITGAQLFASQNAASGSTDTLGTSVAANLGGTATYDPETDTVNALSINAAGATYNTVTGAVEALNTANSTANTGIASALGGGAAIAPEGTVTAPSFAIQGSTYNNVGAALGAVDANLSSLLSGTSGLVQQTGGAPGTGQLTVGAATGGTSVSFAGTDGNRILSDVAGGAITAASDDAVNGAQIFANNQSVANLLGGGAGVDPLTGALTAPSYTVGGTTLGNVGAAIAALQSGAPVQYSTLGAPTTPNGLVPSQNMTLVGAAAGPVTLSNVGPAALNATSTDAVTGSQINTLASSIAANTGGGSAFDPLTGTLSAPTIAVGGANYSNITDAIEAGDVKADVLGNGTADALGGGSTYDPATGIITAPSYTVAGSAYNTVGDAFGGVNTALTNLTNGTSGLVQQTGGAPGTGQLTVGAVTGGTSVSFSGTDGDRVVTGIAAGSLAPTSADAVNGAQVNTLANSLATVIGGSSFDPVTGAVTTPGFAVGGSTYGNVAAALGAVDTNLSTINAAVNGGDGIKYFHTNSNMADSAPVGVNAIAVGPVSGASGDQSVSIGMNASAGAINALAIGTNSNASGISSIAIGNGNQVTGDRSGAIGDPTVITGSDSYSLGNNNTIDANKAFAIGNNITIAAGNDGSVGIGDGATVSAPNSGAKSINGGSVAALAPVSVVSVGAMGSERQITNVAAGVISASSTDAINGSQLFAVGTALNNQGSGLAAALGGGASIATDGTVTAPNYTVQGSSYNNVGGAIGAINGNLGSLNTAVNNLANGTSGLVQQTGGAPGSGVISIGTNTGGSVINVAGTAGDRIVTGVADGSVAAGSKDAVNGGQLAAVKTTADGALQRSGGTLTGSINAGGNSITNLAAPVNGGDATNKTYVDGVAAAAAATSVSIGQSTALALGGGATFDPGSGQVSAPTYTVGGKAYNNAGAAIAATNMLAVQYVADANGQPTNAVRLTGNGNGQAVAMTNVAAGTISAASTDAVNGGQLFTVQQTADGALQRSGGTLSGNLGFGGNRATGLGGPVDASDAATKGYVDSIQAGNVNAFNLMTQGLNTAFKGIERNSQGVALAIAMGGGFLSDDKDVSLWGAWGNFNGYNAASLQTYIRLSDDVFINAAASYGFQENLLGTRVGVGIQF